MLNPLRVISSMIDHVLSPTFQDRYLQQPASNTPLPPHIRSNPKFFPFFDGALGAMDGTHILAQASEEDHARHRSRTGQISQNMMAACTFTMLFTYICSGWEGSASDSQIFDLMRENPEFKSVFHPSMIMGLNSYEYQAFVFLRVSSIWQMQDFLCASTFLCHIVECAII
jgi:hypothetical protein